MKATVSGVVEDLKFKISECYDQNWGFPDSAQLAKTANWSVFRVLGIYNFVYLTLYPVLPKSLKLLNTYSATLSGTP